MGKPLTEENSDLLAVMDSETTDLTHEVLIKTQFLSHMAHEIRIPMNGLIRMSELLKDTSLNHQQLNFVEMMIESGNRILQTMNEVIEQLSHGEIQPEVTPSLLSVPLSGPLWFKFPIQITEKINSTSNPEVKILIAEDNPVNLMFTRSQLDKLNMNTRIATNGKEALEALQQEEFDLILMDCQMPEMNGFEATQAIRLIEKTTSKHIPIVALTGNTFKEDQDKCLQSGMDDTLSKPIKISCLREKLHKWIPKIKKTA